MMKIKKTNAIRILEQNKINYEYHIHDVDKDDIIGYSYFKENNIDLKLVYKTLVLKGDKTGFLVAMLPLDMEIDLKKLAKCSKNKSIEMINQKDLTKITGYIRGGCSPIGMKKTFSTYIQDDVLLSDKIYFSAGMVGGQIYMEPKELIKLLDIKVCGFAKYKEKEYEII